MNSPELLAFGRGAASACRPRSRGVPTAWRLGSRRGSRLSFQFSEIFTAETTAGASIVPLRAREEGEGDGFVWISVCQLHESLCEHDACEGERGPRGPHQGFLSSVSWRAVLRASLEIPPLIGFRRQSGGTQGEEECAHAPRSSGRRMKTIRKKTPL